MRITSSSMVLHAARAAVSFEQEQTSVTVRRTPPPEPPRAARPSPAPLPAGPDAAPADGNELLGEDTDLRVWITRMLLRALFGVDAPEGAAPPAAAADERSAEAGASGNAAGGIAIEVRTEHIAYEAESVHVSGAATVTTADGRRIDAAVRLDMAREYYERTTASLRIGGQRQATDPLVLHLQGGPVALNGPRTAFDLDADGQVEHIATPSAGSAFLALDRDGDGVIGDGRELFGPTSGDGFGELAALDTDADGWIDEDDDDWARLRLWETATGAVTSLGQAGVGAIATGSVRSQFSLGQTAATADGVVAATGVFLHEDGRAGTVQHIDLMA